MSKDEDKKEETKKEENSESKDSSSPDLNVKTLEEILREKAIKKMMEKRAQDKEVKSEDKETEEEEENMDDKDTEKAEKEVSNVASEKSENSPLKKVVRTNSKDGNVESSDEKLITTRKVSSDVEKAPLRKIISLNNKDNNNVSTSSETTRTIRKVSSNDGKNWPLRKVKSTVNKDNNSGQSSSVTEKVSPKDKDSNNCDEKESENKEPPSPFAQVKVKSFDEIMKLKRKRRAEMEALKKAPENVGKEVTASAPEQEKPTTLVLSPPKRVKTIIQKSSGDGDMESKVESSSGAESSVSKAQPVRKRTVFVMEKPSSSKQNTENG